MEYTCLALHLATRECKNIDLENLKVGLSGFYHSFVITCFEGLVSRNTHTHKYFASLFQTTAKTKSRIFRNEINRATFRTQFLIETLSVSLPARSLHLALYTDVIGGFPENHT